MNHAPSYHENVGQRSPCLLVIDVCTAAGRGGDLARQRDIDEINAGLNELRSSLQADAMTRQRVQLSVIEAGGARNDAEVVVDWVDAADFEPPAIASGTGPSHLTHALRLALQHVERHKQTLKGAGITYTRPWIMVISGGEVDVAESGWAGVVRDCRQAERDKRCVIFPIVLEGGFTSALQMMSMAPVARLSVGKLGEYFQWLCAALSSTSRSAPGAAVALPSVDKWARFD